jgi:PIN domain nuclease of toxin-antitoxin system
MSPALSLDTCVLLWLLEGDLRIVDNQQLPSLLNKRERFFSSIKEMGFFGVEAKQLGSLPYFHKDPFDRMLISTAIQHGMTIVTSDTVFCKYPVQVYTI